ncbi:hypothetical protein F8388_007842 [Cannabis sativa]|uniref:Protein FAR1-RELATED SEQUENCE n=1 Tax=Cannabis sativa TaxID=3483 RepID=A0A7J6FT87_CANSA|nr:hypothetical protein F8388_007842 [Cannabis sativa]
MDNEWLRSMYSARQQWVPVYMRDAFFGEVSGTEGSGGLNLFFDGFVNASTTIQMLVKQYEKAIVSWHEKELKADYDTINTTPEELVETLANPATKIDDSGTVATYRVAKFGEDHQANAVSFNSFEMKASCSCQMFEYSGIICRHVLAVFRAKNVLTLPSQYVLKRWTRNAKTGPVVEEQASELPVHFRDSLTVRYNNLRQEAIKFVEEGAKSIHIYNVALDALQEAAKKVASIKNRSSGATQGATLANGGSQELHSNEENQTAAYQSVDEKEKKINELTTEIENTNQRCEVYRTNLLAVLRDMEEQKLKLSVKVQNAKLSLKE